MRRIARLALLLAGLSFPAFADGLSRTITGDMDGDGVPDRVEIQPRPDEPFNADVVFFLSKDKRTVNAYQLVQAEGIYSATIDGKGELHLEFGQLSGRLKSRQELHIGLQGGKLVVRRYRLAAADGLADAGPDKAHFCEVDFVANTAIRDDKPAERPGPPVRVEDWAGIKTPAACQSLF